jgi:hypothetical protein
VSAAFRCFPSFNDLRETAFALRSTNDAVSGLVGLKDGILSVPPVTSVFPDRFPTQPQPLFPSQLETRAGNRIGFVPKPFTRFVGVEMISRTSRGAITPGSEKLGWIRVGFNQGAFPPVITIYGWAYNTNGPINAGEIAPGVYVGPLGVPEPSTLPVMLLAAGAAGVLEWKRRRNLAAKA